jgi:hypothetical protein
VGGACGSNGGKRNVYRLMVGKPEAMIPLGRSIHRWIYNINMDLSETGLECVDRISLAQDRCGWRALVKAVMNLSVP